MHDVVDLAVQPAKQGKRRGSASKPSEAQLQLSGLLYIMYLLANDEVSTICSASRVRSSAL